MADGQHCQRQFSHESPANKPQNNIPEPSFYKKVGPTPSGAGNSSDAIETKGNQNVQETSKNTGNPAVNDGNDNHGTVATHQNSKTPDVSADELDLTDSKVPIGKLTCIIRAKVRCGNNYLYAIESPQRMEAYSDKCPRCEKRHIASHNPRNVFYALVEDIHDKLANNHDTDERAQGPKSTNQLPKGPEKALPLTERIIGPDKGIEGDANSCYMDSTIFCMFAYSGVFDSLLNKEVYDDKVRELQTILRENIVNMLRNPPKGLVGRDALYRLRLKLSEVTGDKSFREEEKDPTEFLRTLENLFEFAPLKTIPPNQQPSSNRSNITSNIMWEMFDPNISKQPSINIASIFRNSLTEIPARLATIPPFLILIAPRHSRTERSYRYIIPDRKIKVDHHMVQLVCEECNKTNHDPKNANNFYHCYDCSPKSSPSSTEEFVVSRCYNCIDIKHNTEEIRNEHQLRQVKEIVTLNLFAVLCIERCHYVAFVKCQKSSNEHEWLFFDSMSDREGNTKNIPSVTRVPDFEKWIADAEKDDELFKDMDRRRGPGLALSKEFPGDNMKKLRLFRDGAFFFYENPTANYH